MREAVPTRHRVLVAAVLLVAAWAHFYVGGVSMERSRGWDEAMHAELPAARMQLAAGRGDFGAAARVALDCQQYPPAYPALVAAGYSITGVQEVWGRRFGRLLQALGLGGLFLLGRRLVRSWDPEGVWREAVPPAALLLGMLSPLWLAYSGTFFLEGPTLTVSIFTLLAWLGRDGRPSRELLAGSLATLAFFTKFNYALALGAGLFVDLLLSGALELRAGRAAAFAKRAALLAIPPVLGALWWFVLPWPGDRALGAQHFEAFTAFLSGNQQLAATPYDRRIWDAATFLFAGPLMALVVGIGLLLSLRFLRRPGVRTLWIVFLVSGLPVWLHNFHLDRFLLPAFAAALPLAGVGLARVFGPSRANFWFKPALGIGLLLAAVFFASPTSNGFARYLGLANEDNAAYVGQLHTERLALLPARRLPTAGLERAASDAFLEAIAGELAATERVGWLGITSELSPGALHLGLFERGAGADLDALALRLERDAPLVREDGQPDMVVTFESVDPGWDTAQIESWAAGFDLVLGTRPIDWKGRRGREFLEDYQVRLLEGGVWSATPIAEIPVARPIGEPTSVELFALRRKAE